MMDEETNDYWPKGIENRRPKGKSKVIGIMDKDYLAMGAGNNVQWSARACSLLQRRQPTKRMFNNLKPLTSRKMKGGNYGD